MNINGQWEGELKGKVGHFPFTHVEFIEQADDDDPSCDPFSEQQQNLNGSSRPIVSNTSSNHNSNINNNGSSSCGNVNNSKNIILNALIDEK